MMARSTYSNRRPNTLTQDCISQRPQTLLQRAAGPYIGVTPGNNTREHNESALPRTADLRADVARGLRRANNRTYPTEHQQAPALRRQRQLSACRSLGSETRHDRLGEPPHVLARTLAEQQDVGHALRLERGQLACDLRGRADQRMRLARADCV